MGLVAYHASNSPTRGSRFSGSHPGSGSEEMHRPKRSLVSSITSSSRRVWSSHVPSHQVAIFNCGNCLVRGERHRLHLRPGRQCRVPRAEPTRLLHSRRLTGAWHRNDLARRLDEMGYVQTPTEVNGLPSFELAGCLPAILEAFSTRRRDILPHIAEKGRARARRPRGGPRKPRRRSFVPSGRASARPSHWREANGDQCSFGDTGYRQL